MSKSNFDNHLLFLLQLSVVANLFCNSMESRSLYQLSYSSRSFVDGKLYMPLKVLPLVYSIILVKILICIQIMNKIANEGHLFAK